MHCNRLLPMISVKPCLLRKPRSVKTGIYQCMWVSIIKSPQCPNSAMARPRMRKKLVIYAWAVRILKPCFLNFHPIIVLKEELGSKVIFIHTIGVEAMIRAGGYKFFSMLNSAEHKIFYVPMYKNIKKFSFFFKC